MCAPPLPCLSKIMEQKILRNIFISYGYHRARALSLCSLTLCNTQMVPLCLLGFLPTIIQASCPEWDEKMVAETVTISSPLPGPLLSFPPILSPSHFSMSRKSSVTRQQPYSLLGALGICLWVLKLSDVWFWVQHQWCIVSTRGKSPLWPIGLHP